MSTPPDIAITGRIATLAGEAGFGWVSGLVVTGGRVTSVGRAADAARAIAPTTRLWRLPDELCVIPGITDAHLHLAMAARAATMLHLDDAADRAAILDRIAVAHGALAVAGDAGTPIEGHGWSVDRYGGWPTAADLEAVAPGRRVSLWSHDHHARWVSRDLLRAVVPHAGANPSLVRRDDLGVPSGILHEAAAALVDPLLPDWDAERRADAVTRYGGVLATLGITGVHDPGELSDTTGLEHGPAMYRDMARHARLPLRVWASVRQQQLSAALGAGMRTGAGQGRYRDGWLKLFADGALGSRSAALLAPWEPDDPAGPALGDATGLLTASADELHALAARAATGGIAVQVHGIGDRAVRVALDVLAQLPRVDGARHRVEHAQLVDPVDIPRFAGLGVAASVQPCHLCTDEPAMRVAWGGRTANAFPLGSLDATGALMPLGTDAPVEPPDPWRNLAAAVSRSDPGWPAGVDPFHAQQALPVARAVRAACLDPAITAGRDDLGRLVPGAAADLVVVPVAGLLEAGPRGARLAATRPLLTVLGGEVVHQAPEFHPEA